MALLDPHLQSLFHNNVLGVGITFFDLGCSGSCLGGEGESPVGEPLEVQCPRT